MAQRDFEARIRAQKQFAREVDAELSRTLRESREIVARLLEPIEADPKLIAHHMESIQRGLRDFVEPAKRDGGEIRAIAGHLKDSARKLKHHLQLALDIQRGREISEAVDEGVDRALRRKKGR